MKESSFLAKTFLGLESILASELINLGANNVQIARRAVSFTGNQALLYRANLCCRTALRILKPILTFKAKNADEVYEKVKQLYTYLRSCPFSLRSLTVCLGEDLLKS